MRLRRQGITAAKLRRTRKRAKNQDRATQEMKKAGLLAGVLEDMGAKISAAMEKTSGGDEVKERLDSVDATNQERFDRVERML